MKETSRGEPVVIVAGGVVGFDDSGAGGGTAKKGTKAQLED